MLVWPVAKGRALLVSPSLFFALSLPLEKSDLSSVFSARSSSRHLIIILSGARARLIDAPLHCLPQVHDLTKTFSSSTSLLSFSPLLKRDDFIEDGSVLWQEEEEKPTDGVDICLLRVFQGESLRVHARVCFHAVSFGGPRVLH